MWHAYGRNERNTVFSWGRLMAADHLKDLGCIWDDENVPSRNATGGRCLD